MKRLLIFIAVLLPLFTLQAQEYSRDYISIGAGPGMMYGDNTGNFNRLRFNVAPAAAFTINKQLSRYFDIRATIGAQGLNSGEFAEQAETLGTLADWGADGHAFAFTGHAFFADFMPVVQLNPNYPGRVGNVINWYLGAGIGYMMVNRNQEVMQQNYTIEESREEDFATYVPVRIGFTTNLEATWELGFELSALTATTSNLDGNTLQNKALPVDILAQFQFKIIKYIGQRLY
jgi:hypothetical protein